MKYKLTKFVACLQIYYIYYTHMPVYIYSILKLKSYTSAYVCSFGTRGRNRTYIDIYLGI